MFKVVLGTVVGCLTLVTTACADDTKGPDARCLDGTWTVACYEKNGETQKDAKGMTVKVSNGTITCAGKDGKGAMTMKAVLGPNGTIHVTEGDSTNAHAKSGVYVLSKDTLAVCLHADKADAGRTAKGEEPKPHCVIVLKRDGERPGGDK